MSLVRKREIYEKDSWSPSEGIFFFSEGVKHVEVVRAT